MSYVTQANLENRFGAGDLKAWTDDDASGSIDTTVVAAAITETEGLINGAAGQHYVTPLSLSDSGTAALIRLHAVSIAAYLLASRRPEAVADNVRTQYEDALKWLERLRDGKEYLAGETTVSAAKPAGGVIIDGGSGVVTRDSMDGL
jgi:phage gp36-like protein